MIVCRGGGHTMWYVCEMGVPQFVVRWVCHSLLWDGCATVCCEMGVPQFVVRWVYVVRLWDGCATVCCEMGVPQFVVRWVCHSLLWDGCATVCCEMGVPQFVVRWVCHSLLLFWWGEAYFVLLCLLWKWWAVVYGQFGRRWIGHSFEVSLVGGGSVLVLWSVW